MQMAEDFKTLDKKTSHVKAVFEYLLANKLPTLTKWR